MVKLDIKNKIDNYSLVCLETEHHNSCINYGDSFKLNFDHYQKVLEAKGKSGIGQKGKPKEGDFVYVNSTGCMNIGNKPYYYKPMYGWVKKDKDGKLFIQSFDLIEYSSGQHSYCPVKIYLNDYKDQPNSGFTDLIILFSKHNYESAR